MEAHFADRLEAGCRAKGNALCVGLDPRWEFLPKGIRERHKKGTPEEVARAYEEFCLVVLEVVAPLVAVVKPQSAFFEACGPAGLVTLQRVLQRGRELGLLVILDSKRNDIASTGQAYAEAVFGGQEVEGKRVAAWEADAMTVNPYLGRDAVEPFLACARKEQGGIFVLVRTSNKGAGLFQDLSCDGKPLYQHVGLAVGGWARENLGRCGLGDVGAVVGATHPEEMALLRRLLPEVIFLVPGYGAQGGSAADTAAAFRTDGLGAIINSSRGIISCFAPEEKSWEGMIGAATKAVIKELREQTPMGKLGG
jgi:orotidine-5'-phosphate decarboxylase